MKNFFSWAAIALGVLGLVLAGPNQARADGTFSLDLHCGSGCATLGPFGTVTVTTVSGGIDLKFVLTQGDFNGSGNGNDTIFFNVGTVSGFTIQADSSTTKLGTGGWSEVTPPTKTDGLSAGTWTTGFDCNVNGGNCGQVFDVMLSGTGLALNQQLVSGITVYAGVDPTCGSNATHTCTLSNLAGFNTGVVGATTDPFLTTPVPGPIIGSGLPGLIAACAGLVAFARRRRRLRFA
jgi:hypothetical protein